MATYQFVTLSFAAITVMTATAIAQKAPVGYDDTPMQPNGKWRIHDGRRPQPAIVNPGPAPAAAIPAPADAVALIGAQDDLSAWQINSGVFLLGKFEIQILDSYQNRTYPDGQAAAMYGQYPPLVNASRGPGEWQTYDIVFSAPRFNQAGALEKPAIVSVLHNGVVVHHATAFWGPTTHKAILPYKPDSAKGPIALQDHGNPVHYRNVWIRPLKSYDGE